MVSTRPVALKMCTRTGLSPNLQNCILGFTRHNGL